MRLLRALNPPHIDRHRAVVAAKKDSLVSGRLNKIDVDVAARYLAFEAAITGNALFAFAANKGMQLAGDDLRSCYGIKAKTVRAIFAAIKSAQRKRVLSRCPYCGIAMPTTHDHYLPASEFPELSVHALNLVPCCPSCNEKKGGAWRDSVGRIFFHLYSDDIPRKQFLFVSLKSAPSGTAISGRFAIKRPPGVSKAEWRPVERHFHKLGLLNRYSEFLNEEIEEILEAAIDHLKEGGSNSGGFVRRQARRLRRTFGRNHWRAVLYFALAESKSFLKMVADKV